MREDVVGGLGCSATLLSAMSTLSWPTILLSIFLSLDELHRCSGMIVFHNTVSAQQIL